MRQTLSNYRRYQADGPRRISLMDDGVETEAGEIRKSVFHAYSDFDQVEEDSHGWYLTRPGQRVVISKGHCTRGIRLRCVPSGGAAGRLPCCLEEPEEDE